MTPKIGASIEAIRAISHQFGQRQTAIKWLEWLHRKLSNNPTQCQAASISPLHANEITVGGGLEGNQNSMVTDESAGNAT
jgi:hypothetical protein